MWISVTHFASQGVPSDVRSTVVQCIADVALLPPHERVSVIKRYNLVLVEGWRWWRRSEARKVTTGLGVLFVVTRGWHYRGVQSTGRNFPRHLNSRPYAQFEAQNAIGVCERVTKTMSHTTHDRTVFTGCVAQPTVSTHFGANEMGYNRSIS